jgi:flagellar basal body-associated protein FliL
MINTIIPLANWGLGTAIIIFFVVVCVVLTALVINFWLSGKKKNEED